MGAGKSMLIEWTTKNNTKYVLCQNDNHVEKVLLTALVGVGANQDGKTTGLAHFLEHMLVMFIKSFKNMKEIEYHLIAYTDYDKTIYQIECDNNEKNIAKCIFLLQDVLNGTYLNKEYIDEVKRDIINEYHNMYQNKKFQNQNTHIFECKLPIKMPIGSLNDIKSITFTQVKDYYYEHYQNAPLAIITAGAINQEFLVDFLSINFHDAYKRKNWDSYSGKYSENDIGNRYSIIFNNQYNSVGIYLKTYQNHFAVKCLDSRVLEDICFVLIENLLTDYLFKFYKQKTDVKCTIIKYCNSYQYLCIDIDSVSSYSELSNMINPYFLYQFNNYIKTVLSQESLDIFKDAYKKNIVNNYRIDNTQLSNEVINQILYGEIIYSETNYLNILNSMSLKQILQKLNSWLRTDNIDTVSTK